MSCFNNKGEGFQGYLRLEDYIVEKNSYDLTDDQRAELQSILADIQNRLSNGEDGDYSKAYEYLKGTIPADNPDASGLGLWLNVAIGTNSGGKAGGSLGNIIDKSLRLVTDELLKSRSRSKNLDNQKYNQFSNEMAQALLNNIALSGIVSLDGILKSDA